MAIDVDLSEFQRMSGRVASAGRRFTSSASTAVRRTAKDIEADARAAAPVGPTGDLQRSINATVTGRGANMSAVVTAGVDYAIFVHEGTSVMPARPFLADAFDARSSSLLTDLADLAESEL